MPVTYKRRTSQNKFDDAPEYEGKRRPNVAENIGGCCGSIAGVCGVVGALVVATGGLAAAAIGVTL